LRNSVWASIVILCGLASSANAAGIQLFNHGPALSGAIWYPCQGEPKHVDLGNLAVGVDYGLVGVKDCPVMGAKLPLIVFSQGAYTGLVVVGAAPDFARVARGCKDDPGRVCEQLRNGETLDPPYDARIKAAVIADPPSGFFTRENLAAIKIPLQYWRAEVGI